MNGTFLISYVKNNKWFHSAKTCLSHGKTISPFRLIYTLSATVARPLTNCRFLLFLLNKRNALEKSTVYYFNTVTFYWSTWTKPGGVIYMCVRDIEFTYFYDFSIECWNCSDSVIYIFSFYYMLCKKTVELQLLKTNMVVIVFRN